MSHEVTNEQASPSTSTQSGLARGQTTAVQTPTRDAPYEQALRDVVGTYAWINVTNNLHMLPDVQGFAPATWVNLLTMQERAALAAPFTEYVSAVRALESAESQSRVPQAVAEDYIQARRYLDVRIPVVVNHVESWLTQPRPDPLPKLFPYDPGGRSDTKCTASRPSIVQNLMIHRNKIRRRKVIDICSGQQSLAQYLLAHDAAAIVLSIDIITRNEALCDVPDHLQTLTN